MEFLIPYGPGRSSTGRLRYQQASKGPPRYLRVPNNHGARQRIRRREVGLLLASSLAAFQTDLAVQNTSRQIRGFLQPFRITAGRMANWSRRTKAKWGEHVP